MLLNTSSTEILNNFQNAYYNQIGRKMIIGSEEYTLSSVFCYVLAVWSAMVNASYDARFIDTARGSFLDKIASQYSLTRTPLTWSNPFFEAVLRLKNPDNKTYSTGTYSLVIAGYTYLNSGEFTNKAQSFPMRWTCTETHSEALSKDELKSALEGQVDRVDMVVSGLESCAAPMADDEEFRAYITRNKRVFSPGIADAFEAVVLGSSEIFTDAHCIRQGEPSYEPGKVKIIVKPRQITGYTSDRNTLITRYDIPAALDAIKQQNIITIGTESISITQATSYSRAVTLGTLYISKSYEDKSTLTGSKLAALKYYINEKIKIGENIISENIIDLMKKPLDQISTNNADFNLSKTFYDQIKDFVILGAGGSIQPIMKPSQYNCDYLQITAWSYDVMYI